MLRGIAGRRVPRALEHPSGDGGAPGRSPLPRRHSRARDRARSRQRRRPHRRLHADPRSPPDGCPSGGVHARFRPHGDGARHPLRLRPDRPVGARQERIARGDRGQQRALPALPGRDIRPRSHDPRRVHRARRGDGAVRAGVERVAREGCRSRRAAARGRRDRALVEEVGGAVRCRRAPRRGDAFAHHAEGADLLADWRHRGVRHHIVAGEPRRGPQLGLPVLLDPRRHVHDVLLPRHRLSTRGAGVARLALARGRRRSGAHPGRLRPRG